MWYSENRFDDWLHTKRLLTDNDFDFLEDKLSSVRFNDLSVSILELKYFSLSEILDDRAWRCIGSFIAQNTTLFRVIFSMPTLGDMTGLCDGLQNNRCIKDLWFVGVHLGASEKMSKLVPVLRNHPSLNSVVFQKCSLGHAAVDLLMDALSSRSEDTLETLNLTINDIGDSDVEKLFSSLVRGRRLKCLKLGENRIALRGCTAVAQTLVREQSNLEHLLLDENLMVANESAVMLANALVENKRLTMLSLAGTSITAPGWTSILQLVCNRNDVLGSNHTLNNIGPYKAIQAMRVALERDDADLLLKSLEVNRVSNKMWVVRQKIIWRHERGDLNIGDSSIVSGAMPRILAWFGNNTSYYQDPLITDTIRLGAVHRILCSRPGLCASLRPKQTSAVGAKRRFPDTPLLANKESTPSS